MDRTTEAKSAPRAVDLSARNGIKNIEIKMTKMGGTTTSAGHLNRVWATGRKGLGLGFGALRPIRIIDGNIVMLGAVENVINVSIW